MTDLDRETQAAIEALAHRLRVRDAAIRNGEDCEDPEPFAQEFITAFRGRGWRPTEARTSPQWQRLAAPRTEPTDEWKRARAELEQKLHRPAGDAA